MSSLNRRCVRLLGVLIVGICILYMGSNRGKLLKSKTTVENFARFIDDSHRENFSESLDRLTVMNNLPGNKVIILAYMRAGSSLTGDIIQQHPQIFYIFEPLCVVYRAYMKMSDLSTLEYLDNTTLPIPNSDAGLMTSYLDIMQSVLKCEVDKLDIATLMQPHMDHSFSTLNLPSCLKEELSDKFSYRQANDTCVEPVISSCKSASVIVIKLIRMRMRQVGLMMSADPKLKVIHLIRDPRGCLTSRRPLGYFPEDEEEQMTEILCSQILEDIQASKILSQIMPNRILTMRYEDLAESPVKASQELFKFMDLNMPSTIEEYIKKITYSGLPANCNICTTRPNATETAYKWRKKMSFETVSMLQQICKTVLDTMGYRPFDSEPEMRDFQISAKHRNYDPELIKVTTN